MRRFGWNFAWQMNWEMLILADKDVLQRSFFARARRITPALACASAPVMTGTKRAPVWRTASPHSFAIARSACDVAIFAMMGFCLRIGSKRL